MPHLKTAALLGLLFLSLPLPTYAHIPYTEGECGQYSKLVGAVVEARDRGVPMATSKAEVVRLASIPVNQKSTYLKDKNDVLMTLQSINTIYSYGLVTKTKWIGKAYAECMGKISLNFL
jgi:hypothetical protein